MDRDVSEMTAEDVIEFVQLLNKNRIHVILDGGWGVDALLETQTRKHEDLDIAVEHKDASKIRALLEARNYRDVPRDDTTESNFVLGDEGGHLIDFHTFTFDPAGKIVFGVPYPFESLTGSGRISGIQVNCITPEWMVKFHTGYKLDGNDYHDVKLLCQKFGFDLPAEYEEFELMERKENNKNS